MVSMHGQFCMSVYLCDCVYIHHDLTVMFTFLENPIQIPPGGIDSSNAVGNSSSVSGTMHQDDLMDDPIITGKHQVLTIHCQDICKYADNIEQWDYYSEPVEGKYPVPSEDDGDDDKPFEYKPVDDKPVDDEPVGDKPVDDKPGD